MASSGWSRTACPKYGSASVRSLPVTTATTPSSASAAVTSIDTIRPCGTWLRTSAASSIPANSRSPVYSARPRTLACPSIRTAAVPTGPDPVLGAVSDNVCISRSPRWPSWHRSTPRGRLRQRRPRWPCSRCNDRGCPTALGAPIPRRRRARRGRASEGEHHARCAEATLQGCVTQERVGDGLHRQVAVHALDRRDIPTVGVVDQEAAELTASPSISTVHAPQTCTPQDGLVPVNPRSSRSTSMSSAFGADSTRTTHR